MKKIIAVLVLLTAATALFASGNSEDPVSRRGMGFVNSEEVSLTGTLALTDARLSLETDGKNYSLSVPGYRRVGFNVEEGMEVTVNGALSDCLAECPYDADGHIFVASAIIDGEEVDFANAGPAGRNGRRMAPRRSNSEQKGFSSQGRGGRGRR